MRKVWHNLVNTMVKPNAHIQDGKVLHCSNEILLLSIKSIYYFLRNTSLLQKRLNSQITTPIIVGVEVRECSTSALKHLKLLKYYFEYLESSLHSEIHYFKIFRILRKKSRVYYFHIQLKNFKLMLLLSIIFTSRRSWYSTPLEL